LHRDDLGRGILQVEGVGLHGDKTDVVLGAADHESRGTEDSMARGIGTGDRSHDSTNQNSAAIAEYCMDTV
jgi:hypothetical protein